MKTILNFASFFSSVQSLSRVWLFETPWTAACQASLSITNSWSLFRLMSIGLVMPSSHLILCHPILLSLSIFPSIRDFSNESFLRIRWLKYWRWSFSISPSSEYSRLIFFRINWLDLLEVQGTLKSLSQHHSSNASILWCSAFFICFSFSSVAQSCPTLYNPMNRSTPGLSVLHQLPESTQTHVHWVGDVIQPSHPLSSPSPPALSLSQYQGLFKWVSSSHQVAKVLDFQLQHQSFQWTLRTDLL